MANRRQSGKYYEDGAIEYLKNNGIEIIDRNVHMSKIGEIDIIGIDRSTVYGDTLVFFEVKYRSNDRFGSAIMAITDKKKQTMRKCAAYYLAYKKVNYYIRFDIIAIDGEEFKWYKNAF